MISDGGLLSDCAFKKHPHLKVYQMRVVSEFIVAFLSVSLYRGCNLNCVKACS